MSENPNTEDTRRRDLLDALSKTSEMHYHELLVIVVLIAGQGIAAAIKEGTNGLIVVSMVFTVLALGAQLWFYHDQVASIRMRLKPLLEGEDPTPDAKTRQELDWLTQQDPWLDRVSVWGLWLGAAFFVGGCLV